MKHKSNETMSRKPTHGFTLIELLVVISIIALLLSILLPSLQRAKESARTIVCSTRLKNIGLACNMYIMDQSKFLPYAYDMKSGGWCWPNAWAGDYLGQGIHKADYSFANEGWKRTASDYFSCPSRKNHPVTPWGYEVFGYGMNVNFGMILWGIPYKRISDIRSPSRTILMLDVEGTDTDGSQFYLTNQAWDNYAYRHGNSLNILFFDGHVGKAREEDLPLDRTKRTPFLWEF